MPCMPKITILMCLICTKCIHFVTLECHTMKKGSIQELSFILQFTLVI